MPDPGDAGDHQRAMVEFAAAVVTLVPYAPPSEQLAEIRGYLIEIQAAINLLPGLEAIEDGLDVGFDPAWPEGTA